MEPNGANLALTLIHLGTVEMNRGDLATAEDRLRHALTIQKKLIPESFEGSINLNLLGRLAERRGDFAAAEEYFRCALQISRYLFTVLSAL